MPLDISIRSRLSPSNRSRARWLHITFPCGTRYPRVCHAPRTRQFMQPFHCGSSILRSPYVLGSGSGVLPRSLLRATGCVHIYTSYYAHALHARTWCGLHFYWLKHNHRYPPRCACACHVHTPAAHTTTPPFPAPHTIAGSAPPHCLYSFHFFPLLQHFITCHYDCFV